MRKNFLLLITLYFLQQNFVAAQMQGNWSLTGPAKFPTNISGQINGMGRVSQIKFHPTNPAKVYAVSATGGLWISENSGVAWQLLEFFIICHLLTGCEYLSRSMQGGR